MIVAEGYTNFDFVVSTTLLQWGRNLIVAEGLRGSLLCLCGLCFNGAAT